MFDAKVVARVLVGPARAIAGCKDAGGAGLEKFIDGDSAVDCESCVFGKAKRRPDADADNHQVRRQRLARFERDISFVDGSGRRAEVESDAVLFVDFTDEFADLAANNALP